MDRTQWIARYADAWREQNPAGALALFTDDAVYHASPTGPRYIGPAAIADLWKQSCASWSDLNLRFGLPVSEGVRCVVEWWATMRVRAEAPGDATVPITRAGVLVLRLTPEGRCDELWQYRTADVPGKVDASPGWGI